MVDRRLARPRQDRHPARSRAGWWNGWAIVAWLLLWPPVIALAAGPCEDFPGPGFDDPAMRRIEGPYTNTAYGFSVEVPPGVVAHADPEPAPDHGFGIVLGGVPASEPSRYLWVDASYEMSETVGEVALTETLNGVAARAGAEHVERRAARLGGLPAFAQVVTFSCPGSQDEQLEVTWLAHSPDGTVVFTLELRTTADHWSEDRGVLAALLASFRLLPP